MGINLPILVIEKNLEVHEKQSAAWERRGFVVERVESMREAIIAISKSRYMFVGINADNIVFLPQLRILCDSPVPVSIITSSYSVEEHNEARRAGAASYGPWDADFDKNVEAALIIHGQKTEQLLSHRKAPKILHYEELLISVDYYKAYVNEIDLDLSKAEIDILIYLLVNRGRILSKEKILRQIDSDDTTPNLIWNHIKNLRKKLLAASPKCDYIQTRRSLGYCFKA